MKKLILLLIAIFALSAFAGCGGGNTVSDVSSIPEDAVYIDNKVVDYTFYYPSSWEPQRNDAMILLKPAADKSGISPDISLSVSAFSLSSDKISYAVTDQWKEYKAELEKTFGTFSMKSEEELTLDDAPAARKTYTVEIAGNVYRYEQIICVRNANVYLLTFTALDTQFDAGRSVVDYVTDSFDFK